MSNQLSARGVHGASDGPDELVVVDGATPVNVEVVEELGDLRVREAEHVVLHGLGELVGVKGSGTIVIHNLELSAETDNSSSSSGG